MSGTALCMVCSGQRLSNTKRGLHLAHNSGVAYNGNVPTDWRAVTFDEIKIQILSEDAVEVTNKATGQTCSTCTPENLEATLDALFP